MYKFFIRPVLFLFQPEKAHHLASFLQKVLLAVPGFPWLFRRIFFTQDSSLEVLKQGIRFPNPVGLAAGFDKNATLYKNLAVYGFGFIEVGTVTPRPQPGNPKPRIFRLLQDQALINRMGFNNLGVKAMRTQLEKRERYPIIGGNIGKNKDTPNEQALDDYLIGLETLHTLVDYFAVNVSSPNTPGLRNLQEKEPLLRLLMALRQKAAELKCSKPILLKIAPDLSDEAIQDIAEVVLQSGIQGIIATNTSIGREGLNTSSARLEEIGAGGLSGKPVFDKSNRILSKLRQLLGKDLLIIGAGGIHSAEDAWQKLEAGADVVQIYTGFIYEGPALVKQINQFILKQWKQKSANP